MNSGIKRLFRRILSFKDKLLIHRIVKSDLLSINIEDYIQYYTDGVRVSSWLDVKEVFDNTGRLLTDEEQKNLPRDNYGDHYVWKKITIINNNETIIIFYAPIDCDHPMFEIDGCKVIRVISSLSPIAMIREVSGENGKREVLTRDDDDDESTIIVYTRISESPLLYCNDSGNYNYILLEGHVIEVNLSSSHSIEARYHNMYVIYDIITKLFDVAPWGNNLHMPDNINRLLKNAIKIVMNIKYSEQIE